jgi:hypothetical protein
MKKNSAVIFLTFKYLFLFIFETHIEKHWDTLMIHFIHQVIGLNQHVFQQEDFSTLMFFTLK